MIPTPDLPWHWHRRHSNGVDMADPQTFATGDGDQRQTLVVVFLRGGADGLNLVAPLQDDGYYNARPRIAINKSRAVPLDGFYGLNPLLRDLEPAYKDGALAIIHALWPGPETPSSLEETFASVASDPRALLLT